MVQKKFYFLAFSILLLASSCKDTPTETTPNTSVSEIKKATIIEAPKEIEPEKFVLDEENAIPFFFEYEKTLKEDKVKITTNLGSFTIELYDNVPYHKANFIYLAKKGYFDSTLFHRVVKNFIIQGGNSDNPETGKKRAEIGRYLLPPDTKKGYKHHRGTISMPSSELDNPHKLASPFEFFIVVTKPGSYHLDSTYTAFGKVIEGMDVVDLINSQPVEQGDWPIQNIHILKAEAF
ncbi:peptidylprolyl isomerase [Cellulophaga baltica]|uniref:Peptidyl-prolyl cis-trans isomerase n=1 Tax=Cellulophaga baltica 18 TaxID=1348584 RepID=A0AAU8RF71_9FLAO|nr:peptidylprolyl isomerase [Cellulophaga baltica]AIZ42117.1 peptidylprolyl isomerase [Cellulophaga baltica 18]